MLGHNKSCVESILEPNDSVRLNLQKVGFRYLHIPWICKKYIDKINLGKFLHLKNNHIKA